MLYAKKSKGIYLRLQRLLLNVGKIDPWSVTNVIYLRKKCLKIVTSFVDDSLADWLVTEMSLPTG